MSLAVILGGAIAPILLLLSPFSFGGRSDCAQWNPPAKAAAISPGRPCPRPPMMMLM